MVGIFPSWPNVADRGVSTRSRAAGGNGGNGGNGSDDNLGLSCYS